MTRLPVLIREVCLPVLWPIDWTVPFGQHLDRLQRLEVFSAQNKEQAEALAAKGVAPDRIVVIPDGVHMPEEQTDVAQNDKALIIANIAQGKAHKAFDILLDAWAHVNAKRPGTRLTIIGGRGDKQPWVEYARDLGIADVVDFIGWVDDLTPYMRSAALFLLPSRREGVSIALLTAQSWGLPAVVSDIPGNRFVVEHERNGLVVPVGDAEKLADAILRLYEDPALRVQYGEEARRVIEQRFSLRAVATKMIDLYRQIEPSGSK
jgi:glycosyltransferase involved in cell wall biosynthesis